MNTNKDLQVFFELLLTDVSDEKTIVQAADLLFSIYTQQSNFKTHSTICSAFTKIIQNFQEVDALDMVMAAFGEVIIVCKEQPKYSDFLFLDWIDDMYDNACVEYQRYLTLMDLNSVVNGQQQTIQHTDVELEEIRKIFKAVSEYQGKAQAELQAVKYNTKIVQDNIDEIAKRTQQNYDEADKEIKDLRKSIVSEVIAVLGIFVSIVVACFGTITIIGNVSLLLSEDVPLYKVLTAFFAVALILLDVLSLLIYFIGRLCGKSITASCKYGSCEQCERKKGKCNACGHFFHKQYHLIIMNIVLVLLMILTLAFIPGIENDIDEKYHGETTVADTVTDEPETETDWVTEFQTAPDDTSVQTE